jgi:hypothetical protein
MADVVSAPVTVICPEGQWSIVATATTGQIHKIINGPTYLQTYRPTGSAAPTSRNEGVRIFSDGCLHADISFSSTADIYIWCDNGNGRVRVDV